MSALWLLVGLLLVIAGVAGLLACCILDSVNMSKRLDKLEEATKAQDEGQEKAELPQLPD